ncbi:MAG TPA: glutamine amidotransferase [Gammaproteobacteria bacterium]|nr:glutamine amidotransferase [Gammaproteobacteria bacterium]
MKSLLAIRHVPFEDLGCLEAPLTESGYAIRYVDAPTADFTHIAQAKWDLLVVLGGPIGVNEQNDYPFIIKELRLLELRLKNQAPTLGICLGSQLMAHALGARIHKNRNVEIGWKSLILTNAGHDSSLQHFQKPVFHWHGDSFDLPAGARHLASTDLCPHQAFSLGSSVLGLQFHPEVTARGLEQWYVGHTDELRSHGLSPAKLRKEAEVFAPMLAHQSIAFLRGWLASH